MESQPQTGLTAPRRRSCAAGLGRLALLTALAVAMAAPFLWMVMTSLKPLSEVERGSFAPQSWQWENYAVVLGLQPPRTGAGRVLDLAFGKWYFNSLLVAGWVTFLQLLTSSMAGYAFSRLRWRGRDAVFALYIATMMIPGVVLIVPNYFLMVKLHLVNTYLGLILPASFGAFGTFLMRQYMLSLPRSLDEAAALDGASKWHVFVDVILPQCGPALITLAIFIFLGNYASFFWPLIMIKDSWLQTLPIGMLYFEELYGRQTNLLMAASMLNVVPPIVVFIALQKFLVRGIQLGAFRG